MRGESPPGLLGLAASSVLAGCLAPWSRGLERDLELGGKERGHPRLSHVCVRLVGEKEGLYSVLRLPHPWFLSFLGGRGVLGTVLAVIRGAVKGRCSPPAQQGEKLRTRVKIFQLHGQEAEGDYEIPLTVPLG